MRRLAPALFLVASACATAPAPKPVTKPVERPRAVEPAEHGDLIGLTANELGARFGQPDLQVKEGAGTKLQWRKPGCVLDAYLYPPESGSGVARVVHVDTRNSNGASIQQAQCLAVFAIP